MMAKVLHGQATAYGPPWDAMEGTGITSTGIKLKAGEQKLVVAVDPGVIPYGTKLKIWPNPFGDPNLIFTAADTGGAFNGSGTANVDFFVASGRKDQNRWGRKGVKITVVGKGSPKKAYTLGKGTESGGVQATGNPKTAGKEGFKAPTLQSIISNLQQDQQANQPTADNPFGDPAKGIQTLTQQLLSMKQASEPSSSPSASPTGSTPTVNAGGSIPGAPSGHVQAGTPEAEALLKAIARRAQKMGLHVGEFSPYDKVDPVHAQGSYHYQKYKDGVNRAADISGDPRTMSHFANMIQRLYGGSAAELIWRGNGAVTRKLGKKVPKNFYTGHTDHVHVAL